jgi:hypothetical protein
MEKLFNLKGAGPIPMERICTLLYVIATLVFVYVYLG